MIQHKFEIRDLDETLPTIVFDTLYKNLITKNTSTDNLDVDASSIITNVSEFLGITYTYNFRFNTKNIKDARTLIANRIDTSLKEINERFQSSILIWDLDSINKNLELDYINNSNFSKKNDEYQSEVYKTKINQIDKQLAKIFETNDEIKNFDTANCDPMIYVLNSNDFDLNEAIDYSNLIELYCSLYLLKIKNEFLLYYKFSEDENEMEMQKLFKINHAQNLIESKISEYKNISKQNIDTIVVISSNYSYQYFESYIIIIILYSIFIIFYLLYLFLYDSKSIKKL